MPKAFSLAVPVDAQDATQTTEPPAEPESALTLESWQDPKYHGKVKPARKLRIDTKSFAKWFNDPTGDLTDPNTGKPKLFYRGFGSYGKHLYISHASKPDAEGNTYNFYMDAKSTAESYAGTSNITKLYDIVNWETAAKAMESIKLELRSGVTGPNGQIGYQLYDKQGFAVTGGWFAETDLEKFRDTYGGTPEAKGIFAGYISVKKPLVIEGNYSNWSNITATVTDGKTGSSYTATKNTDMWAQWAFHHGYDSVILRNISDQASGHGGVFATEVITSKGSMFKSIYNTGKLGKKNNNILYNKAGIFTLTGEPVSGQMKAVLDTLAIGKMVTQEELNAVPEVIWAKEHRMEGSSIPHSDTGYTDEEMLALVGEERYQKQLDIMDELLDMGSAVIDKDGETSYTGKVEQGKRLDIIIGPPAAGKSSALANPISQYFHSRILDSDMVKERLPEYQGGLNAGYVHEESRYVWEAMQDEAIAYDENIVLPIVGHSLSSVKNRIDKFKDAGYSVNLHYLELDGNKTLGRALNRFLTEGRYIDPSYIMSVSDGGIADVYEQLKGDDRIDEYSYWDNEVPKGRPPRLLEGSNQEFARALHERGKLSSSGVQPPEDSGGQGTPSSPGSGGPQAEVTPTKQYSKVSTQQMPGASSMPDQQPKRSPQVIAKSLAKALNVGDYIGTRKMNRVPREVLGYYETRAKYIAVRNTAAGDYTVNMHEIGHALAAKLGMTGTRDMVANLDPVFAANYSAAELPGEAFAEFMWRYMADEQAGRDFAGDTYVDTFETALAQKGMAKEVHKAATDLRMWVNAHACDKIGATVHDRSEGTKLGLREQFRRLLTGTIDASAAAETLNSEIRSQSGKRSIPINMDVRAQSLLKNTASKRAFNILSKNLTDSKWNVVGDSLSTVLENAGLTAKDMQLFERYMLALHSLDRDTQGKPVFDAHITTEAREEFIKDVQTNHPEVAAAEQAFQQWRIDFLTEFLVKPGYLSQEAFDRMNKMYPHYVPTQRVKGERADQQVHRGGKRYQVRRATGSTEDIWSPLDSFAMMIDSIVTMVSANNAALAWEQAANQYELSSFGRQITPDMRMQQVNTEGLQQQIDDLLTGTLDDDLLQQTLDLIGTTQQQWITTRGSNNPNTLVVQHEDGSVGLWEIADVELYKLLASINDTSSGNAALDFIGKLTRGMTALTTGSNPVFAVRNFMRDFQNSVNYGSWASNYVTGAAKWLRAAYDVWTENGDFQAYQALGGGGWNRIEAGTKKGAAKYREALFKDYNTSNVGRTVKFAGKKLWETITAARLNEVVEQASRYAEFKYGQHDLSTEAGRQEAFLAAQDVTTDFNRTGNGNLAKVLKQTVPFFNASAQGVYRTARLASEAERDRLPQRFAKTVVNTSLMSALASGILLKFMDDDEREEFAQMSDELKAQHIYLPNFAPGVLGEQPLIRIPLAQDPLTYAIHGMVTNAIWSGKSDDVVIGFEAIAETILDNLNPLGSGTIFQPLIGIGQNKNWYGSRIIPTRMSSWEATTQYTADTPDALIHAGRVLGMSPLNVQYLAEQYTGFLGQMLIPALSKDEITGELGGWRAAIKAAQKRLTSDPLISNDVVSAFYDGAEMLTQVTQAAKNDRPLNMLRRGLTDEEATAAYEEAKTMTSANGIIGQTKKAISSLYDQIDAVNANTTLTDEQKYALTSDLRRQMIEQTLVAQEAIGAYNEKFVTGENLLLRRFTEGVYAHIPDAFESMPQTFKDDADAEYMRQAKAVWEATGEANVLPHPKTAFSDNKVEYIVQPEYLSGYNNAYKLSYQKYFSKNSLGWDAISDEERVEILKGAHEQAHRDAKKWYLKQPGVFNQN